MKSDLIKILGLVFLFSLVMSCENKLEITMPQGPQGPKGDPGVSAFELWKEYYGKDPNTSIEDFFNSLRGKDGKDGAVPVIGDNGNWIIDGTDTGIPARGKDGQDGQNGQNGVTPEIGSNGNWYIDGVDTGIPARGKDGISGSNGLTPYIKDGNWWIGSKDTGIPARGDDGEDGVTPTVSIGPGPDYFWIINGKTTTVSAKGKDGVDGLTPVVGDNGNWYIGGEDTGKPSVIIPEIGENGNWWIGGVDTGKPARGPKGEDGNPGVDGKSAYELWKEAVLKCDGTVKNKDGSDYDCTKSTWEDFLIWLQGGDVSVLHKYWTTLEGNGGKTIQQFIDELFDCHCDGITVSVIAPNDCVELKPDGTLNKTYNAKLSVGGKKGTSVVVTGTGVNLSGDITNDQTPVTWDIPRGDASIQLVIICTESGNAVTKNALIPALKYIKLGATTPVSVTKVDGEEKDVVTLTFATAPIKVTVGTTEVYDEGAELKDGWVRSEDGKTFTKTYARGANKQRLNVKANGADGECSTFVNLFEIPQLTPVEAEDLALALVPGNNCDLLLSIAGTPGMTVEASYKNPLGSNTLKMPLTETPANSGKYSATVPRTYTKYTVTVTAAKANSGTKTMSVEVDGTYLSPVSEPLTISQIDGVENSVQIALVKRRLTNNTSSPLIVKFSRAKNSTTSSIERTLPAFPFEVTIPKNGFVDVDLYRDYTPAYASGKYRVTMVTVNECELTKNYTLDIDNQTNYRAKFTKPDGFGGPGQPGGPGWDYTKEGGDPDITFTVEVYDAMPNSYVEFQLYKGVGYSAVFRKQVDAAGRITENVTMKASELNTALDNGKGFFKFFRNDGYTDAYNIGASKEQITFAF